MRPHPWPTLPWALVLLLGLQPRGLEARGECGPRPPPPPWAPLPIPHDPCGGPNPRAPPPGSLPSRCDPCWTPNPWASCLAPFHTPRTPARLPPFHLACPGLAPSHPPHLPRPGPPQTPSLVAPMAPPTPAECGALQPTDPRTLSFRRPTSSSFWTISTLRGLGTRPFSSGSC